MTKLAPIYKDLQAHNGARSCEVTRRAGRGNWRLQHRLGRVACGVDLRLAAWSLSTEGMGSGLCGGEGGMGCGLKRRDQDEMLEVGVVEFRVGRGDEDSLAMWCHVIAVCPARAAPGEAYGHTVYTA